MLLGIVIIVLTLLLSASIVANVLLWKAGERQLVINEIYANWISEWRTLVFKTYAHMKLLDDKQIFEKDDEVGVTFQEMFNLIENLNEKTEETTNDSPKE